MSRITSGIDGMDSHIEGGYPEGTVVLVSGGPGAGKTLMGLSFLVEGASIKHKSCYISFSEDADGLRRACGGIKSLDNIEELEKNGLILKSIDFNEDTSVTGFMETVENYPNFDRLVIDNVNKLLMFSETEADYRLKLTTLIKYLRQKVGCTLLLCETNNGIDTGNGESFECDGVVKLSFLELEEKPRRILTVEKLRYTAIDSKVGYDFVIDSEGLRIGEAEFI